MRVKRFTQVLLIFVLAAAPPMLAWGSPSEADCAARADRAARDSTGITGGAVRGAIGGAAFGAIVADNRRGAGRGAALGAVTGGAGSAQKKNEVYKRVYDECMQGKQAK